MEPASLESVLEYENEDVISSFTDSFEVSEEDAREIFKEMLRFIWYSQQVKTLDSEHLIFGAIDNPLIIIDEMWHHFILCTNDYLAFCKKTFGNYIHHQPTTKKDKIEHSNKNFNDPMFRRSFLDKKKQKYEKIYDLLGKDVFVRWYDTYPTKFSKEKILKLRKK